MKPKRFYVLLVTIFIAVFFNATTSLGGTDVDPGSGTTTTGTTRRGPGISDDGWGQIAGGVNGVVSATGDAKEAAKTGVVVNAAMGIGFATAAKVCSTACAACYTACSGTFGGSCGSCPPKCAPCPGYKTISVMSFLQALQHSQHKDKAEQTCQQLGAPGCIPSPLPSNPNDPDPIGDGDGDRQRRVAARKLEAIQEELDEELKATFGSVDKAALLNALKEQGVEIDLIKKTVKTKDGVQSFSQFAAANKDISNSAQNNPEVEIIRRKALALSKKYKKKRAKVFASYSHPRFNKPKHKSSSDDSYKRRRFNFKNLFGNKIAKKKQTVKGLQRKLAGGSIIGVAGDDLFQMINRRYHAKNTENMFKEH